MKKVATFLTALVAGAALATADVTASKGDDGQVELTFRYTGSASESVYLVGNFNGWNMESDPLEHTDDGWVLKMSVPAGTSITYKFVADGEWVGDPGAPDSADDGFGGANAVVTVDSRGNIAAPLPKVKPREQHVEFHTWTNVGAQNAWSTIEGGGIRRRGLQEPV